MSKATYTKLKQKSYSYTPTNLVNTLEFDAALRLACDMLNDEEWDESLQEYATSLLEELRKKFPDKWNTTWKYDALLGYAYDIIFKYDERYAAYKRALTKIQPPPPQLLVALAGCCIAPGKPPVTEEEAISLVKQAIATVSYIEAVELLRGLYKSKGNIKEQYYWEKVLEDIHKNGVHLPPLNQI